MLKTWKSPKCWKKRKLWKSVFFRHRIWNDTIFDLNKRLFVILASIFAHFSKKTSKKCEKTPSRESVLDPPKNGVLLLRLCSLLYSCHYPRRPFHSQAPPPTEIWCHRSKKLPNNIVFKTWQPLNQRNSCF